MNKIERIKCGNGNCFLIQGDNRSILVDTCRTESKYKISEKCKINNVKLIVLTHGHIDHIQNAAFLSKELNAPIAMHKADYELIKNNWAEPLSAQSLLGKIILSMSMKSFKQDTVESFEPDIYLKEGDSFEKYGISATVIELPGHTKGSVGINLNDTDIIVGDALMNMVYPAKSPLYGNKDMMEKSANRINGFGKARIHFGHGKSILNRKW